MFTDFLFTLSITIVVLLAGLLLAKWRPPSMDQIRQDAGALAFVLTTAILVAVGFLVI